ncbi:hypothetical protein DSO57_1028720 [Entomophthora muscae]|uniref:Uncharacterized protein n=1 Tax=Entomophthora muscae TaxID=34485 RepID=A0ACC2UBQ2_9FUNG|nr:hypothetical protein DSO57_1028720 [Entomophthora muscae]
MESSVLSRLQKFLPQLAASNRQLLQEDSMEDKDLGFQLEKIESDSEKDLEDENIIEKASTDSAIETSEEFKPYIEMDLNLGVFDVANDPKTLDALATHCESSCVKSTLGESEVEKPPTIEEL